MRKDTSGVSLSRLSSAANGPNSITVTLDGTLASSTIGDMNEQWSDYPRLDIDAMAFPGETPQLGAGYTLGKFNGERFVIDIGTEAKAKGMTSIQSVYIDASDCPGKVVLSIKGSGQRIKVNGATQGWYPLCLSDPANDYSIEIGIIDAPILCQANTGVVSPLVTQPPLFTRDLVSFSPLVGKLRLIFVDALIPPCEWTCDKTHANFWYDYSTTIAVANTPQIALTSQLFKHRGVRYGFMLQNPKTAATTLFFTYNNASDEAVAYNAAAKSQLAVTNCIGLEPGERYEQIGLPCAQGDVYVQSATNGAAFICKELK